MFNPNTAPHARSYYLPSFEAAARSFKVAPIVAPVHSEAEIETAIISLGREPGGSLVVLPDTFSQVHRAAQQLTKDQFPVLLKYAKASFERIKQRLRHLKALARVKRVLNDYTLANDLDV